jgi:hypothetical protein
MLMLMLRSGLAVLDAYSRLDAVAKLASACMLDVGLSITIEDD